MQQFFHAKLSLPIHSDPAVYKLSSAIYEHCREDVCVDIVVVPFVFTIAAEFVIVVIIIVIIIVCRISPWYEDLA